MPILGDDLRKAVTDNPVLKALNDPSGIFDNVIVECGKLNLGFGGRFPATHTEDMAFFVFTMFLIFFVVHTSTTKISKENKKFLIYGWSGVTFSLIAVISSLYFGHRARKSEALAARAELVKNGACVSQKIADIQKTVQDTSSVLKSNEK